ncbi:MAG: hypothetical protein AseanaTS_07300 [Candidatus Pelagadaptatus aseana]|uniref:complex I subunit 5 family protein n=1 Tax=Candidatus Pelagadaptatus aseana TaxID=3120508 RepID=UPI0039B28922
MTLHTLLPLLIVLSALVPGVMIFFLRDDQIRLRRILNLGACIICLALIVLLIAGVYDGAVFETRLPLMPGMDLVLHADTLSLLFVSLTGMLWFLTTIYAIGYLEGTANRNRFFGFFSLCVGATLGIALAGNLITFLIFYEFLTLATYPLVVHKGNAASIKAGRIYLTYTLIGGALLLAGVVWLKAIAGPLDFTVTGVLPSMPHLDQGQLKIIFVLLIAGLGVKAALVPAHGWLPVAMAAPAPVSALLHAVAVVKAGAFGIIRVVYDVYGVEFAQELGLTVWLAGIAALTIVYGSVRAVFQDDIKKRLAFSTVSQVSYIALGTAIAGPLATIGGMVHLVHQGLMKITMFFCAGNLAETLSVHKVSAMNGVGRRMPLTMAAFTIAALGMIGLPPLAGFVSKWYLGLGALEEEAYWVLGVLAISSLLNAIYFLPMLYAAWFKPAEREWDKPEGFTETSWMLLLPPVATSLMVVSVGIFASVVTSPLSLAKLIASLEYGQLFEGVAASMQGSLVPLGMVIATPLLVALGVLMPATRARCIRLTPWAALPALITALWLPQQSLQLPAVFFGSLLRLDPTSQTLLLLASVLWLIAGLYGRYYLERDQQLARYSFCFLLCMSGSFGLTLSQDVFGFITFFTLMSFAAYGLVVHSGSDEAMRAGKTYIQWVVVGEVLLFSALVGLTYSNGSSNLGSMATSPAVLADGQAALDQPAWVSWLLMLGFGIKAGLLGTHFWLPRAHPVAPVPASALLSGLMVKAGLIGWLRFLPMGDSGLETLGLVMVVLGFAGAFVAVAVGVVQRNPKTLLAYSTISQMGIITVAVGSALIQPQLWPLLAAAIIIYAAHHGLAKAALFLSVGIAPALTSQSPQRWLAWLVVLLPVVAMVGLPLSSGALAKASLKTVLTDLPWVVALLPLTAIGTTVLLLRFIDLLQSSSAKTALSPASLNACLSVSVVMVVLVTSGVYWLPQATGFIDSTLTPHAIWGAIWPVLIGVVLFSMLRKILAEATMPANGLRPLWRDTMALLRHLSAGVGGYWSQLNSHRIPAVTGFERLGMAPLQLHPGIAFVGILLCFVVLIALGG